MPPTLPVLILGAGVSGLCLAQGLLKAKIPFRLFERDPALSVRSQGYRFRIQGPGVVALRQVLTPSMFSEIERTCAYLAPGSIIHLNAVNGEATDGPKGALMTLGEPLNVDRTVVRSVLAQGLEERIKFNMDFEGYEIDADGVEVSFSDGTKVRGCLLVGADGARSRIKRQLVPDDVLLDTQGRFLFGKTALTFCWKLCGSRNRRLLSCCLRTTYTGCSLHTSTDFGMDDSALLYLSSEEAAGLAGTLTSHWDSSFRPIFAHQNRDQTAMLRIASSKPTLPQWEGMGRITLIGDAAHAMSPTAGAGATTAVQDAAALAHILETDGVSADALAKYEKGMRVYAEEPIKRSLFGGKMMFGMQAFEDLKPVVFGKA